jgi:NADH-ubiquinone oxidoreductase chain 3
MKMNSFVIYILFVIFVAVLLLTLNVLLSSHNPYMEKKTAFECGFHSFLGQNRTQFTISFFIFALLFLLFDLEILLIYPYTVSAYNNSAYGLLIMLIFFLLLTGGLVFELGKKALTIYSKQKQNSFII